MKLNASLFSFLYGIGFWFARRCVLSHGRPRSRITDRKLQIAQLRSRSSANSWSSANSRSPAVYGAEGRCDAMQRLGEGETTEALCATHADGIAGAIAQALDELSNELGTDL